jgi:hypothetical protein
MTRRAKEVQASLKDCWVVILVDPDDSGWSPWSIIASDEETAITLAQRAWRKWLEEEGDEREDQDQEADEAEVVKVYRNSWIGEIA